MNLSVVIPTCNRKQRLLSLLHHLGRSQYPIKEIIIVDAGEQRLQQPDFYPFSNMRIVYILSEKSVCIQRNKGIQKATGDYIFLCDDDMEVPSGYLPKLMEHIRLHPEVGAVSGLVMQKEGEEWKSCYDLTTRGRLLWTFVFQNGIWGNISCTGNGWLLQKVKTWYAQKGNHLSKAGWPVLTHQEGDYFTTPVYGLGASVIKRDWLLQSPYDEVLDPHGIGDNYGVAIGFPGQGIHVLTQAQVFHHHEQGNRLQQPLQYYRRTLALHYFIKTKKKLQFVRKHWLLWSLTGNLLDFIRVGDGRMTLATLKSIWQITWEINPYYRAARAKTKVTEPQI